MHKNLYIFLLLLLFGKLHAQTITNISTTESRCQSSGIIKVSASGGTAPYAYSITSGPVTMPLQSPDSFVNLPAGTYLVKVFDNSGFSDSAYATVYGTYILMNPTATPIVEPCPGSNTGRIQMSFASNQGRAPFTYSIISGPTILPSSPAITSTSYVFENLSPGTYQVRVTDSCGNFQTRSVVLAGMPAYTTVNKVYARPNECDSISYFVQPGIGGKFPYTVRAYSGPTASGPATTKVFYQGDLKPIPGMPGATGFEFKIAAPAVFCGTQYTFNYTIPVEPYQQIPRSNLAVCRFQAQLFRVAEAMI